MNELRKLQLVETEIVADIDKICKEYNLTYYMIGGTLLGAVRHKGFIPWDDDIDLVMYRADYEKLIEIISKKYSDKYFVQTFRSDEKYTRYIAKVRLNGTVMVESYLKNTEIHSGVYVDIFPLDHTKRSDGFELKLRGAIVRWLFAYKTVRHEAQSSNSMVKKLVGKGFRWVTYCIPQEFVNWLFDYVCTKDNQSICDYTTNFASHFKWKKQMFENSVYGNGCRLEFEGYMFNAPDEYLLILERLYGDSYMDLPPEDKRENHHIIKLDLGEYDTY